MPTSSYSTSVVGAITEPARASRNDRSIGKRGLSAAPPQACMDSDVTRMAISFAAALADSTGAAASPSAHAPREVRQEPGDRVDLGLGLPDARADRREVDQGLTEVLELRAGHVGDRGA